MFGYTIFSWILSPMDFHRNSFNGSNSIGVSCGWDLATITIGLSMPMRRNQNCFQHIRGVQQILTEWRNRNSSRKWRASGTVKIVVLKVIISQNNTVK